MLNQSSIEYYRATLRLTAANALERTLTVLRAHQLAAHFANWQAGK
jgi:hypothetical protein